MAQRKETKVEAIERRFIEALDYLSDPEEAELFTETVFANLSRTVSNNKNFYKDPAAQSALYQKIIETLTGKTQNADITFELVKKYTDSPLGIFSEILRLDDASDIFIVSDQISIDRLGQAKPYIIDIPDDLQAIYESLVDVLRLLTHYASSAQSTKFDPANPILDYEVEGLRFNAVHSSLNAQRNNRPIISVRHQVLAVSRKTPVTNNYIENLNLTEKEKKVIQDLAFNGSFIICGQTGSGKTTLLRYMGSYKLADKRNLVTIEDTAELFLDTRISYLTNDKLNISDLFKVSLRENPSHMLIGETRNEEIVDILESSLVFNTGTTVHADSFSKLVMRIVFMVKNARPAYATEDILSLFTATMDGVIIMSDRKVKAIYTRKKNYSLAGDVLDNYERVVA